MHAMTCINSLFGKEVKWERRLSLGALTAPMSLLLREAVRSLARRLSLSGSASQAPALRLTQCLPHMELPMHMHWKAKLYFLNLSSVVPKANKALQHSLLDLYNLKSEEVAGRWLSWERLACHTQA